jgi:hypothetical protein
MKVHKARRRRIERRMEMFEDDGPGERSACVVGGSGNPKHLDESAGEITGAANNP